MAKTEKELLVKIRMDPFPPEVMEAIAAMDLRPDTTDILTAREIARDFQALKYQGPGWYLLDERTTVLIVPARESDDKSIWNGPSHWPASMLFYVHQWNAEQNPARLFNMIVNAPTRQDAR